MDSDELWARLEALERGTLLLARRFDDVQSHMDSYYHAFLELEIVVGRLADNQRHIAAFLQGGGPPAGEATGGPATSTWRGKACAHGRRRYRCKSCCAAAGAAGAAGAAERAAGGAVRAKACQQVAEELRALKQRLQTELRS